MFYPVVGHGMAGRVRKPDIRMTGVRMAPHGHNPAQGVCKGLHTYVIVRAHYVHGCAHMARVTGRRRVVL